MSSMFEKIEEAAKKHTPWRNRPRFDRFMEDVKAIVGKRARGKKKAAKKKAAKATPASRVGSSVS